MRGISKMKLLILVLINQVIHIFAEQEQGMEKFQKEVTSGEKSTESIKAAVGAREKEKNLREEDEQTLKVVLGLDEVQRVKDEKTPEAVRKLEEGREINDKRALKTIQEVQDEKSERESVEGRDVNDETSLEAELKLEENHNVKYELATILENVRRRAKYKWISEYLPLVMGATGLREAWKNEHGVEATGKFELAGIQYTHEVDNPRGLEKEEGVNNEKEIEVQWGEEGARGFRQARRNEHEGEAAKNDEGQEVNDEEEVDLWDEEEEENEGGEEVVEKPWDEEEDELKIEENSEDNKVRENCNKKANSNFDNCVVWRHSVFVCEKEKQQYLHRCLPRQRKKRKGKTVDSSEFNELWDKCNQVAESNFNKCVIWKLSTKICSDQRKTYLATCLPRKRHKDETQAVEGAKKRPIDETRAVQRNQKRPKGRTRLVRIDMAL